MRRISWELAIPMTVAAVPIAAAAMLFGASEVRLRQYDAPPPFAHDYPTDVASIARGEHLARTRGCLSCHGASLEGRDFSAEWPGVGHAVAPNLARYMREHDVATAERAIRHGIGASGRALWSMPSYNFRHLTDADLLDLLAYIRAQPVLGEPLPASYLSLAVRWDMVATGGTHAAEWAAALPPLLTTPERDGAQVARGEYLAMTSCNECHGLDLRGIRAWGDTTPDLAVAAGYSLDEFARLMRRGTARDGRTDLGLMTNVAQGRFVHWTADEVAALHAFLRTLPARPVRQGVFWRTTP